MSHLTVGDMLLRIALASVAGALVGWERESRGRAAGLRTTILTSVAAAVGMILSQFLFERAAAFNLEGLRADPARLAAGFLTGIGFLGAGTIIRHEKAIRGVTTAASLWLMTVVGLAFGSGAFVLGGLGVGVALLTLLLLESLEKTLSADWYASLTITGKAAVLTDRAVMDRLEQLGPKVLHLKIDHDLAREHKTLNFELRLNRQERFTLPSSIVAALIQIEGVTQVKWD